MEAPSLLYELMPEIPSPVKQRLPHAGPSTVKRPSASLRVPSSATPSSVKGCVKRLQAQTAIPAAGDPSGKWSRPSMRIGV